MGLLPKGVQPPEPLRKALLAVDNCFADSDVFFFLMAEAMDRSVVNAIYLEWRYLLPTTQSRVLTVVVDSPGGDIHAAYQLATLLRSRYDKVRVVVPRWAKSAATLLCLMADELILTPIAELGPLDPQIRRPGETEYRAALHEYAALKALNNDALELFLTLLEPVSEETRMDVRELVSPSFRFVANLLAPVYQRIDPYRHGSNLSLLQISKSYAEKLLRRRNVKPERASQIAEFLAMSYPSHDYVIDVEELKKLGLQARLAASDEEEALARLIRFTGQVNLLGTLPPGEETKPAGAYGAPTGKGTPSGPAIEAPASSSGQEAQDEGLGDQPGSPEDVGQASRTGDGAEADGGTTTPSAEQSEPTGASSR